MAGLQDAWGAWKNVHGNRSLAMVGKAIGQYDPYQDPKFYKDLERFEQNPTSQNADMMLEQYGDQLEANDKKGLVKMTQPAEGTIERQKQDLTKAQIESQQGYYNKLNELGYGQAKAKNELTSAELGIAKNQFGTNKYNYMGNQDFGEKQVDSEISNFETNLAQNNLTQNKVKEMIEQGYPEQQVASEMAKLNAQETEAIYNKMRDENKIEDADYLYNLWKRNQTAQTQQNEAQADISQVNANIAQATKEDQILSKELAVENQQMQNQKLETQLKHLDERLQKEMNALELQNINREIQNEIARLREEKQRELNSLEIKQAELRIKGQALQNKGQKINNKSSQKELDYLNSLSESNLAAAFGYETGGSSGTTGKFGPEDYVPNPKGEGVAIVNDNGVLLDPNTLKPLLNTGEDGSRNYFVYDGEMTIQLPANTVKQAGDSYFGTDENKGKKWYNPFSWNNEPVNETKTTNINNNQQNNKQTNQQVNQQTNNQKTNIDNMNTNSSMGIIKGYKDTYNMTDEELLSALKEEAKTKENFPQQFKQTYGVNLNDVISLLEAKKGRGQ